MHIIRRHIGRNGVPKVLCIRRMGRTGAHIPPPPRDGGWSIARGHGTVPPAIAKSPLVLPPRMVKPPSIPQGIVTQLSDGAKQLVLDVFVCLPNAEKHKLKALIDTAAQINVIRRGLFPEETLQDAKFALLLTLAYSQFFSVETRRLLLCYVWAKNSTMRSNHGKPGQDFMREKSMPTSS